MSELDGYILGHGNDEYFNAANGVSIVALNKALTNGIPEPLSFDRGRWYDYFSAYMEVADDTANPHAGYVEEAGVRTIQVTNITGTADVLADYLYLADAGEYLILGSVPMQEGRAATNDNVWTSVPTRRYEDPDLDDSWFVLNTGRDTKNAVFATLSYASRNSIHPTTAYLYHISGNLTRVINGTDVNVVRRRESSPHGAQL